MKFSIRNLLGITLCAAILLALLARPIRDNFPTEWEWDKLLSACAFAFYPDFYLLGMEEYWPFVTIQHSNPKPIFIAVLLGILSCIINFGIHMWLIGVIWNYIYKYFFSEYYQEWFWFK